jgi:hypothetical protein
MTMKLTKQDAEREAIRRWYQLREHERQTQDDATNYSHRLAAELDFDSVTTKQKLIAAWLIREMEQIRDLDDDLIVKAA